MPLPVKTDTERAASAARGLPFCFPNLCKCLQTLETTVQAFETTAQELEKAARGVERATLVFQLDVPHALSAVEQAGHEIGSIGRMFNIMGGDRKGKKGKIKPEQNISSSVPVPGEDLGPELYGRSGMQRVVQDITAMTLVQPLPGYALCMSNTFTAACAGLQ